MTEVVLELQSPLRAELKEPMGSVYTDAADLLADAGRPLIAVGDVVTFHLLEADSRPDLALIDNRTERSPVDAEVRAVVGGFDREVDVANPAATLTVDLLAALREALAAAPTTATLIEVDGEEDLATLPAILAASRGAAVVYGQPGVGMVLVTVDDEARERVRSLLSRMDGEPARAFEALGVDD